MRKGFSLIELLVVVVIVALLIGVAAPYYADYVKESKLSKAKADLDVLKQALTLFNSREDIPYQGVLATQAPYFPLLGESDFVGLQGQYLTNIPLDPWSKNYKLDPYGCFVYSEGADSSKTSDDIRQYYVKELALRKVEWEDNDNDRTMNTGDLIYLHFNKAVSRAIPASLRDDFDVYENNQATASLFFDVNFASAENLGYNAANQATQSTLICTVAGGNTTKVGIHSIALKDSLAVLRSYAEVVTNRALSSTTQIRTDIEKNAGGQPLRYAVRTTPIKIVPKN